MRVKPNIKQRVELVAGTRGYYIVRVIYEDRATGIYLEKLGSSSNSPMQAEALALRALDEELQIREKQN